MLDAIQVLSNVASVNNFDIVASWKISASQVATLHLRLWQTDLGIRYVPASGSTLQVKFLRGKDVSATPVDQTQTITFTNPYSEDRSIWSASLTVAQVDKIATGNVQVVLTESGVQKIIMAQSIVKKIPITGV